MKQNYLILISLFLVLGIKTSKAQSTFQKTYGTTADEQLSATIKTPDGGYIMAGSTTTNGYDVYVVKTDSDGVLQWTKTYGGGHFDAATHINTTADGGYIITGSTTDTSGHQKAFLLKIKGDGTMQWTKSYGRQYEQGQHVQQTADKGYVVIGNTLVAKNIYLFKTDSLGTLQWTKTIRGNGCCGYGDYGCSIMQTHNGGYVLLGTTYNHYANHSKIYIAKLATNDTVTWEQSFLITAGEASVASFAQTTDKGFVITGTVYNHGAYLIKTDSVGNYQWGKAYSGLETGMSVIQTPDSGFAFAGTNSSTGNVFICKTMNDGTPQWTKAMGDTMGANSSNAQTLVQDAGGQYTLGGFTNNAGAGQNDFYLLKTDSMGNSYCNDFSISSVATSLSIFQDLLATKDTLGAASTISFQTDTGGVEHTICKHIEAINKYNSNQSVNIYPNPAQNNFTIETIAANAQTLQVYNVNGQLMVSKIREESPNSFEKANTIIDASSWPSGVYNVSIISNNGVINKRVVIVK